MIPGIEQIVKQSCLAGVQDIYFGTHTEKITLLATVLGMTYQRNFIKISRKSKRSNEVLGSGDVKYHLGVSSDRSLMVKVFIYH